MSDELKPCAHCGADAELRCPSGLSWWVQCSNKACGMGTKIAYSDEPVISAWNNRAAPVPPSQEVRDAERYRMARRIATCTDSDPMFAVFESLPEAHTPDALDLVIDAAILAAKEKK